MEFSPSNISQLLARLVSIAIIIFWFAFILLTKGFAIDSLGESLVWLLVLGATLIAWKWQGVGGIIFLGLALIYIILTWPEFSLLAYGIAVLPLALAGSLYLISKYTV